MITTTALRITTLTLAAASALALLSACGRADERTAGQHLDATIAKTEQAASAAGAELRQGASSAQATVQQEAAEAKASVTAAAARAQAAAADATAKTSATVGRVADQVGEKLSDAGITAGVHAELAKDSSLSTLRINVDTVNGQVTLRGSAPSSLARDRATALARAAKGVVSVDNQLAVRG